MSETVNTSQDTIAVADPKTRKHSDGIASNRFARRVLPGILGAALYLLNNLDVLHAWWAPPAGYVPLGVQRNSDIAIYLTWLYGYSKGFLLPNYSAPWITPAQFVAPGLLPVTLLQRTLTVTPVVALQLFTLVGYVFVAYALAFAYKAFCQSRGQAVWTLLVALACVPLDALPFVSGLFQKFAQYGEATGRVHFLTLSDGFLRGLVTWPFLTYGTGFQVLSMALLARYVKSGERRWVWWLTLNCLISTLLHPFEIFVTVTTAVIVLTRKAGFSRENLRAFALIGAAAAVGLFPYVFQTLRSAWMHEVADANSITLAPAMLAQVIGLPVIVIFVLLFFGLPESRGDETLIAKTWLLATLALFFVPGMPFALHMLDGSFFAIGFLLVAQIQELLAKRPQIARPLLQYAAVPLLIWALAPHVLVRAQAWSAGVETQNEQFPYDSCTTFHGTCLRPSALAPAGEVASVQWLREHASPDDLVLATEDAAPWMAQAPVHSFASHWLFSLLWPYPNYRNVRNAFFSGALPLDQGHKLLELIGARFVVVPDGSPAGQYLTNTVQRARLATYTIYEVPGAHMKPYHDAKILALGGGAR